MKVTCDVIEDLLPSYADGLLSDDSRELVEEHLKGCASCREKLKEMHNPGSILFYDSADAENASYSSESAEDTKNTLESGTGPKDLKNASRSNASSGESAAPLRRIKRKLLRRLIIGMTVAALIVVAVMRIHSYFYYEKETYIPYESADIYLDNSRLVTRRSIAGNRLHDMYSPDQTVEFLYLADTAYARNEYPDTRQETVIKDFDNPYDSSVDGADAPGYLNTVTKVYYVSEDMVKELDKLWKMKDKGASSDEISALVNQIEGKSILLWEK